MRILVVEDHPVARDALCRVLRRHAVVDEARGVLEAAVLLRANVYDVVLVDEVLEDGSGRSLLSGLDVDREPPGPRRILMSAYDEPRGQHRPYDHFVQKPDDLLWLVRCVREISAERRAR